MNQAIKAAPEFSAEEGIRQIRQLIGNWFADDRTTAQDTLANIAHVLLETRLDCIQREATAGARPRLVASRGLPTDRVSN